jgi:hypothetical protein
VRGAGGTRGAGGGRITCCFGGVLYESSIVVDDDDVSFSGVNRCTSLVCIKSEGGGGGGGGGVGIEVINGDKDDVVFGVVS